MTPTGRQSGDLDVVRAAYAALGAQDVEALTGLTDERLTIVEDDGLPFAGRYEGYAGLAAFLTGLSHQLEWSIQTEALFVAGDRVVQWGRLEATVRASGQDIEAPEVHVWELEDDRVLSLTVFMATPALSRALARGDDGRCPT